MLSQVTLEVRTLMILNVSELDAFYGHVQVLRKVSIHVDDGELVTLIGANGAGKSTFLMAVCGMMKRISGSIEFMGARIDKLQPHLIVRLGISQVPQERLLFPQMTILENLEMGTRQVKDFKNKSYEKRLDEVFSMFPVLGDRRTQNAGTLSGGEQQMLAMSRALMAGPKLLILDEPSFGLSPIMVLKIGDVISKLNAQGLSILLVEQNAHLALDLASRGYVLQTGSVVLSGKTSELAQSEVVKRAYLGSV
jgi:branched-chain amino acid transport system ATP-binding protein